MKLSLDEKSNLVKLSERVSDLLVDIIDEELPSVQQPTNRDIEVKNLLSQIYQICPLLSDSYTLMYNHIQEQKISSEDTYYKKFREK